MGQDCLNNFSPDQLRSFTLKMQLINIQYRIVTSCQRYLEIKEKTCPSLLTLTLRAKPHLECGHHSQPQHSRAATQLLHVRLQLQHAAAGTPSIAPQNSHHQHCHSVTIVMQSHCTSYHTNHTTYICTSPKNGYTCHALLTGTWQQHLHAQTKKSVRNQETVFIISRPGQR